MHIFNTQFTPGCRLIRGSFNICMYYHITYRILPDEAETEYKFFKNSNFRGVAEGDVEASMLQVDYMRSLFREPSIFPYTIQLQPTDILTRYFYPPPPPLPPLRFLERVFAFLCDSRKIGVLLFKQ